MTFMTHMTLEHRSRPWQVDGGGDALLQRQVTARVDRHPTTTHLENPVFCIGILDPDVATLLKPVRNLPAFFRSHNHCANS